MGYQLYEYRRQYRQVKFCYGCRTLKNKSEFYDLKSHNGNGKRSRKLACLCKMCENTVKRIKYKNKKGGVAIRKWEKQTIKQGGIKNGTRK